jgi:hypothetical protein
MPDTKDDNNSSRTVDLTSPTRVHNSDVHKRCKMSAGSVVESAIERTLRGKSGCEGLCRFPNTGGLHRTPGDAPLETHSCTRPAFCHVSKSCSLSSRRIQVAAVAYRDKTHFLVIRHSTIHRRGLNKDKRSLNSLLY